MPICDASFNAFLLCLRLSTSWSAQTPLLNGFRFKAFGLDMYGAWGPEAEGCDGGAAR